MATKIIQFVTKADTNDYLLIKEALNVYDDYLHNNVPDLNKAIKVRALIQELKELRKVRKI
jgi:homoserine acetyltransferase